MSLDGNPEIDRVLSRLREQLERYSETREQLAGLNTTAVSPDGHITVDVGPSGHLTGLRLNPRAMRMDSQTLADTIMATVREAQAKVAEQVNEIMAPFLGATNQLGALTTGQQGPPPVDPEQVMPVRWDSSRDPLQQVREQVEKFTRRF
jgi:DNA-binding protein YbaB